MKTQSQNLPKNREARGCFQALQKIGAPVFCRPGDSAHFYLSAEDNAEQVWADYYGDDFGYGCRIEPMYINPRVREIVEEQCGLFLEWESPGCLGVYDA